MGVLATVGQPSVDGYNVSFAIAAIVIPAIRVHLVVYQFNDVFYLVVGQIMMLKILATFL